MVVMAVAVLVGLGRAEKLVAGWAGCGCLLAGRGTGSPGVVEAAMQAVLVMMIRRLTLRRLTVPRLTRPAKILQGWAVAAGLVVLRGPRRPAMPLRIGQRTASASSKG
jgi:hypothetical protein